MQPEPDVACAKVTQPLQAQSSNAIDECDKINDSDSPRNKGHRTFPRQRLILKGEKIMTWTGLIVQFE